MKQRARGLKRDTYALYLAAQHPDTPWIARVLAAGIAAYAFSPIDLIPDFVPILGYLDDIVLVPLGIALAVRLVPPAVLDECRTRAADALEGRQPMSRLAGVVIVVLWLLLASALLLWLFRLLA